MTVEPARSPASSHAFATARRQYGFISSSMPSRRSRPSAVELHLFELRDLLDEHRDAHGKCSGRRTADYRVRLWHAPAPGGRDGEAVIVDCARSAFGKRKGALAGWHPTDLLGLVLRDAGRAQRLRSRRCVDDVVGGCVTQSGEQGCNVTRNAWVAAGLPWRVPATSVDRQCGSSQQAAHFVAQGVIAGAYDIAIACGVESMTRAPMSSNARGGIGPFSADFLANTEQHARHPVLGRAGARRQVGHHPRGDGRVRAAVAPSAPPRTPTTASSPARSCRCRSRTETGEPHRRRCSTTDEGIRRDGVARGARGAAAGVGVGRPARARHHRRQLVADDRRRGGDADRRRRLRRAASACRSGPASATSRSPPRIRCSCSRRRCPSRTS